MSLLNMSHISGGYGDALILQDLSLHVDNGEIVVIVGPNGAGKSTAMKAVFGLITIFEGNIDFDGVDITHMRTNAIVDQGIGYVPQVANVFPSMSIQENFEMGGFKRASGHGEQYDRIYTLFPDLADRRKTLAGQLSGGQRQMVAMGRALMLEPRLLLLDEPTAGLSPKYMDRIFDIVRDVNKLGIAVLMVEQNARQALAIADRGYVLTNGTNRYEDTGEALLNNPEVARLFLGA